MNFQIKVFLAFVIVTCLMFISFVQWSIKERVRIEINESQVDSLIKQQGINKELNKKLSASLNKLDKTLNAFLKEVKKNRKDSKKYIGTFNAENKGVKK